MKLTATANRYWTGISQAALLAYGHAVALIEVNAQYRALVNKVLINKREQV